MNRAEWAARVVYADAHGNDFLLLDAAALAPGDDPAVLAPALCDRSEGRGADGLIVFHETLDGASMTLRNADGSYSEVSGNGVRCLAAHLAAQRRTPIGGTIVITTDAGPKHLTLLAHDANRFQFRAAMGEPKAITRFTLDTALRTPDSEPRTANSEPRTPDPGPLDLATLNMGNPQCVVLDPALCTDAALHHWGPVLATHTHFPEGTNVEFVRRRDDASIDILIWERGVGPTASSGTGSCAAAVAAAAFLGAPRDLFVHAPGGVQRVEWMDDAVYLTGWATLELPAHFSAPTA